MRTHAQRMGAALALASALAFLPILGTFTASPAYAACLPGERLDGTTANDAARRMASAGYPGVIDLRKGCDNYWHGIANRNGAQVRVNLSPTGAVIQEGD